MRDPWYFVYTIPILPKTVYRRSLDMRGAWYFDWYIFYTDWPEFKPTIDIPIGTKCVPFSRNNSFILLFLNLLPKWRLYTAFGHRGGIRQKRKVWQLRATEQEEHETHCIQIKIIIYWTFTWPAYEHWYRKTRSFV